MVVALLNSKVCESMGKDLVIMQQEQFLLTQSTTFVLAAAGTEKPKKKFLAPFLFDTTTYDDGMATPT